MRWLPLSSFFTWLYSDFTKRDAQLKWKRNGQYDSIRRVSSQARWRRSLQETRLVRMLLFMRTTSYKQNNSPQCTEEEMAFNMLPHIHAKQPFLRPSHPPIQTLKNNLNSKSIIQAFLKITRTRHANLYALCKFVEWLNDGFLGLRVQIEWFMHTSKVLAITYVWLTKMRYLLVWCAPTTIPT